MKTLAKVVACLVVALGVFYAPAIPAVMIIPLLIIALVAFVVAKVRDAQNDRKANLNQSVANP